MPRMFSMLIAAGVVLAPFSAQALTKWDNFQVAGFDVKARYVDGNLRFIKGINPETGETFTARVGLNDIATITMGGQTTRIDLDAAQKRIDARAQRPDIARVQ